ncbi:transporter substrate-binding domain-containing protein [Weissella sagaensis]|jgi:cystine transport system substrate-binding protein|uniref:Transporter substrate-binding domain-containing protein n=1 Tax=Weissella sagaensis TaxID=2559928 RepID=A0ABW1RV14_9LACO|nr:transporter substrate-binding domain-containing protein [Weissella sagaensis]MBU7567579.1 transporter substrate-binding domain-containing protein [Weissella hellenica]QDJ59606.1 amino acid ABC transporter substrate-binding protein [Weissella hellenica]QEA56918.1 transporter substrate-binding domain-containing protein [Weissella hellenica]UEG67733.1 transporter substrate-binding domain-containing protein [Weissella hellenica]
MNKYTKIAAAAAVTLTVASVGTYAALPNVSAKATPAYQKNLHKKGTLTIGLEGTYSPYSYRDKSGKLTGFEVDLSKAVAKKLNLKPEFSQTKFDSLVAGLGANKYDVVYNNMGKNKEREKHYTFASPYLYTKTVMITKPDSDIKSASDLKGKRSAQSASSNFGQAAKKAGTKIVSVPGFAEAIDLINSGKADVTLNSQDSWGVYKKAHPETKLTAKTTKLLGNTSASPMVNKKDKALAKKITKAQQELKKDGTMSKLSEKYFGSDLTKKP